MISPDVLQNPLRRAVSWAWMCQHGALWLTGPPCLLSPYRYCVSTTRAFSAPERREGGREEDWPRRAEGRGEERRANVGRSVGRFLRSPVIGTRKRRVRRSLLVCVSRRSRSCVPPGPRCVRRYATVICQPVGGRCQLSHRVSTHRSHTHGGLCMRRGGGLFPCRSISPLIDIRYWRLKWFLALAAQMLCVARGSFAVVVKYLWGFRIWETLAGFASLSNAMYSYEPLFFFPVYTFYDNIFINESVI